jgi:hypothetical protein
MVHFTADEVRRVNRVRIAERLHKFPAEVDMQPLSDIVDIMEVWRADDLITSTKRARVKNR